MKDSVKYTVLLAEDNPDEVFFVKRSLKKTNLPISLQHVENGEEAIKYLQREGVYVDRERYPFPALLLTDLKMPLINGLKLLEWVRHQQHLKELPVVIMSSSGDAREAERVKELGATAHYVKTIKVNEQDEFLKNVLISVLFPNEPNQDSLR
jgi:CheY-like chemotaxis protein